MKKRRVLALAAAGAAAVLGLTVAQPAAPAEAQGWAHYGQLRCGSQFVEITFRVTANDSRWGYSQTSAGSGDGTGPGGGYYIFNRGTHVRHMGVNQIYLMKWASPGEGSMTWRCVPFH